MMKNIFISSDIYCICISKTYDDCTKLYINIENVSFYNKRDNKAAIGYLEQGGYPLLLLVSVLSRQPAARSMAGFCNHC